jgi:hypothetical protein
MLIENTNQRSTSVHVRKRVWGLLRRADYQENKEVEGVPVRSGMAAICMTSNTHRRQKDSAHRHLCRKTSVIYLDGFSALSCEPLWVRKARRVASTYRAVPSRPKKARRRQSQRRRRLLCSATSRPRRALLVDKEREARRCRLLRERRPGRHQQSLTLLFQLAPNGSSSSSAVSPQCSLQSGRLIYIGLCLNKCSHLLVPTSLSLPFPHSPRHSIRAKNTFLLQSLSISSSRRSHPRSSARFRIATAVDRCTSRPCPCTSVRTLGSPSAQQTRTGSCLFCARCRRQVARPSSPLGPVQLQMSQSLANAVAICPSSKLGPWWGLHSAHFSEVYSQPPLAGDLSSGSSRSRLPLHWSLLFCK